MHERSSKQSRRRAIRFIVALGFVSLFADITYEGARGISGPFMESLGASAAVVGVIAGLGELIGYGLRVASGWLSDRLKQPWWLVILGYLINLGAVPMLALAGRWEFAAGLLVAERFGKAIRSPGRDVFLSHAASQVGRGWAFGIHEAMDQIGAVVGPLFVAGVILFDGRYTLAFALLGIPAALSLAILLGASAAHPNPRDLERKTKERQPAASPGVFKLYLFAAALIALGYVDFPILAYHFKHTGVIADGYIPLLYAGAMGVDAVAALVLGPIFDRHGVRVLIVPIAIAAAAAPLALFGSTPVIVLSMVAWGVGMGAQESIMRAVVAQMIPADRRGAAFGMMYGVIGVSWFVGSAAFGALYDVSIPALAILAVAAELMSLPILFMVAKRMATQAHPDTVE